jgi:small subunit ribosomal protein S20
MANIRSAEKQRRQSEKAKIRNRGGKSRLKSALKTARGAVVEGKADLSSAFSEIDKAAKRGISKNNTADRYKARRAAAATRAPATGRLAIATRHPEPRRRRRISSHQRQIRLEGLHHLGVGHGRTPRLAIDPHVFAVSRRV